MEIASVTPACAPCKTAAARFAPLPFHIAHNMLIPAMPVQIQLITMHHPSRCIVCGMEAGIFVTSDRHR